MIHPTAILEGDIRLPDEHSVEIGPYAVLRGNISIGPGCVIAPHACIEGIVEIGENNKIGHGATIGAEPQDLSFDPSTPSGVRIGNGNTIREACTIHRSTKAGGMTVVGDRNFLMCGAHLAHDVVLGSGNVIANNALFGGHVSLGDGAFVGGAAVFHQFIRIGDGVMIQGMSGFSMDLAPFVIGCRVNMVAGLNVVGLRRAGVGPDSRSSVKKAYERVVRDKIPRPEIAALLDDPDWSPEARRFLEFCAAESKKPLCRAEEI